MREARELAEQGRGGDTEVAHLTLGEVVLPDVLQTPAVLNAIRQAAVDANIPLDRLRVGSARNRINPNTGMVEFAEDGDIQLPGGDTVSGNVERTRQDRDTWGSVRRYFGPLLGPAGAVMGPALAGTAGAGAQWLNRVWPGHDWDYKQQTPGNDAPGNYNYGATGSALLPEEVLLRGAGAAQMFLQNNYDPKNGVPWGRWPYGDDPNDSRTISAGYAYGQSLPRKP